ncbi:MAG TPA: hypothetical protein VHS53_02050, partial [Mucilaginibacter sp.]|nr:hypothetical protein [Mucilaginibacter sp.]
VTYSLMDDAEKNAFYYSINPVDGKINPKFFELPHNETDVMRSILSSWKKKETVNMIALDEEATIKHQTYIAEKLQTFLASGNINMTFSVEAFLAASPKKAVIYTFNFAQGYIFIIGSARLTSSQEEMVLRFTKVFELTYRRFLDIKQAEKQARESQIQLALERVRARTMAMQKSEELRDVIQVIYDQLVSLGFEIDNAGFLMDHKQTDDYNIWVADSNGVFPFMLHIPYFDHIFNREYLETRDRELFTKSYPFEEKNEWWTEMWKAITGIPEDVSKAALDIRLNAPGLGMSRISLNNVGLYLFKFSGILYTEAENATLIRFGKVFEQTYTRFKDLEQAEDQARESQIQLALERVRARTMAMQKSEELAETVFILFQQFKELGENPDQATIGIINEEEHVIEYWVTMHGEQTNRIFKFSIDEPNVTHKIYKAWKAKKESLVIDLAGKDLLDFMKYRASMGGAAVNKAEKRRIINVAFFSKGLINVQSSEARSEESVRLLERFAAVFDGTYTRFLDLKQAEAQARESEIQLALERVRARTMAMQKSEELHEVIQLVFDQLHQLNFNIATANFALNYKETDDLDLWIAVAGAKYATKICVPY